MNTEPIYSVRFTTRGRVTIPAALRRKFGIKGGSRVAFAVTPEGIVLKRPATPERAALCRPSH
ncbi:MAG: AbrB/MazE/SpoVT family DNA-binding domain-containing protein [Opitutales bacterium]